MNRRGSLARVGAVLAVLVAVLVGPVAHPACGQTTDARTVDDAIRNLERSAGGAIDVKRSATTGLATFVAASSKAPLAVLPPTASTPEQRALAFLVTSGAAFGVRASDQVRVKAVVGPDELGIEHVRLQQMHNGVPVTGGELIVHLAGGAVLAMNGTTAPATDAVDTVPTIDAATATAEAGRLVAEELGVPNATLSEPRLEILDSGLLTGTPSDPRLVWYVEARTIELREAIWIDAHDGGVVQHFDRIATARNRRVFDAHGTTSGTLVRSENGPATGDLDADGAYTHVGDAYDYFLGKHQRDSYDGFGATIRSFVHVCFGACPYRNAFWNGLELVYGDGYPRADDVVAHELTHAVTEHSADLLYCSQTGALNESFSDVFGETVDLTNGRGNDSSAVRWLIGEDEPNSGPLRSLKSPNLYFQPAKISDTLYFCTFGCSEQNDNGGVHINSGVPNHAFALMVDGGSYNGVSVAGIGLTKAAKIEYRALTAYLTSSARFVDAYHALNQSCGDLVGSAVGITTSDCTNVKKALDAVEMGFAPCQPVPTKTPTPLRTPGTPTGTATPTVTVTPTPTITRTPTPTITATPVGLVDVAERARAAQCQRALVKTGSKLVDDRLKLVGACAASALRCVQSKAGVPGCAAKAAAACAKKVGALSAVATKRVTAIVKDCVTVASDALRGGTGLGYSSLAALCGSLGTDTNGAVAIAECVARHHACGGDELVTAELPRTGALIEAVGIGAEHVDDLACLSRGSDGAGGAGIFAPMVERCAANVRKAGRAFVVAELGALGKCLASTFACEQAKPGGFPSCVAKAGPRCRKALPTVLRARAKMVGKIQVDCGAVPFAVVAAATGAGFAALETDCARRGVTLTSSYDYAECLARQHECQVDDLLGVEVPRKDELLGRVGMANAFPLVACPGDAIAATTTPTPVSTATVSATATPTVTPTETETPTPTETPTRTPTPTLTATPAEVETPTPTESLTPTPSATETESPTPTPTPTESPTPTPEPTTTATETSTPSETPTPVATVTPTEVPSPTPTETDLPTASPTASATVTDAETPTPDPIETPTVTEEASPVETASPEPTATETPGPEI